MTCPRRFVGAEPPVLGADDYIVADRMLICTYCGSVEPGLFLDAAGAGVLITPTDKNYKVYVQDLNGKFYFQHFDQEQQKQFLDLYNAGRLNLDYPGYFYVTPYFATTIRAEMASKWFDERGL